MSDSLGYISCAVAVGAVGATYLLSQSLREDEGDDMLSDSLPTAKRPRPRGESNTSSTSSNGGEKMPEEPKDASK